MPQPGEGTPTGKSVVLYGLLLQDVSGSPSPNGAFWSIAVEAQLYFFFPLLLLLLRRYSTALMLGGVGIVVITVGLLSPHVHAVDSLNRFTPQFALLFATGIAAAGVVRAGAPRLPWFRLAAVAALPPLLLIVLAGQKWSVTHLFWVDLALAPAVTLLLAAIATGQPSPLVRALDTRPLRSLGSFSYSLYLIHAPLVVVLSEKVVAPHFAHGTTALLATLALAVPVSLLSARLFAAVFEIPFTRHRSWGALREALRRVPAPEMTPVAEMTPAPVTPE
jgi:peptidoglycan/LPS O-acetylase OafA/YrhL